MVALCDLNQGSLDAAQARMARYNMAPADEYCGEDAWMEMCRRDDIDLVYVVTNWQNHAKMGIYAMEQGKHVAIEVPQERTALLAGVSIR